MYLNHLFKFKREWILIVPFSSHVSPSNPSAHLHENLLFTLWQDAPFLQGELSHGLTKDKRNVLVIYYTIVFQLNFCENEF